eukprot:5572317-Pyramimonas_sp.AAC.1
MGPGGHLARGAQLPAGSQRAGELQSLDDEGVICARTMHCREHERKAQGNLWESPSDLGLFRRCSGRPSHDGARVSIVCSAR